MYKAKLLVHSFAWLASWWHYFCIVLMKNYLKAALDHLRTLSLTRFAWPKSLSFLVHVSFLLAFFKEKLGLFHPH